MTGSPAFLPYGRQWIEEDDIQAVVDVLRSDHLTTGPAVERFEAALAERVGAPGAAAVASGTAALHAACFAAGVGDGDEVIVPAVTFPATANCALYLGADPVFADVDPETGLVDPASVAARLSARTRAIVPVHLTGLPADLPALHALAERTGARIIEDAAHALGAERDGRATGACAGHSDLAVFSFHPVKQVTTGEGGAVTARDETLLERVRLFRNHGMVRAPAHLEQPAPGPWYYEQQGPGHNLRLSDIHAALGGSQLAKLDRFLARRRSLAARYDALLGSVEGVRPAAAATPGARSAHHLYAARIDFDGLGLDRAEVMESLRRDGIGTQVHYIPLVMQPVHRARGWHIEDFPGARRYYERTLSLPLFPAMLDSDVDRVVASLANAIGRPLSP